MDHDPGTGLVRSQRGVHDESRLASSLYVGARGVHHDRALLFVSFLDLGLTLEIEPNRAQ